MKKYVSIILVLLLAQACLPTLHPLFTAKDLIRFDGLEGFWTTKIDGKTMKWYFESNPDADEDDEFKNIYLLRIIQDADTLDYAGGIGKLGDAFYLDMYLPNYDPELPLFKDHMYPVHTIWKFEFKKDSVLIHPFNSDWIRNMITNNQIRIKHEDTERGLLITAGTKELQSFVKKYGKDARAYGTPKILTREP